MNDEVKALQDNETWDLVRPPTDRDVLPGKWVYKVKLGTSGQVNKYKVRYVAKSFKQVEGLDYFETFAPTCKPETFRILLQLSAKQGHVMHQFDIMTAFLHSPIDEEVYLEQPQEFVKCGSDGEKLVCRLNKSIYDLKKANNNWYKELAKYRERYIETMLERFQMNQCKPSRTPADLNLKLQAAQNGDEEVDQRIYRSLVGSLLCLAKQMKPDIMFTVNIVSR